jgi:hypothetical protein
MKERPVLFSGPMVKALLAGCKTQTRRTVKPRWLPVIEDSNRVNGYPALSVLAGEIVCPYGEVGDHLWVRETWNAMPVGEDGEAGYPYSRIPRERPIGACIVYAADGDDGPFRPSIHMPRWASRITLEIVSVRVERLQAISKEDAIAEGLESVGGGAAWQIRTPKMFSRCVNPRDTYRDLWGAINGYESWDGNPWVWCISFKMVK